MFEETNEKEEKDYYKEIKSVTQQCDQSFYINLVDEWLSYYDDGLYLGCEINKIEDVVVALYHYNTIYLIGKSYKTVMYAPKLMFHYSDLNNIHIDDVLVKHNNVGNGSIIMRALFKYAQKNGIQCITGTLSSEDDDHKARRDHYYEKFGFIVNDTRVVKLFAIVNENNSVQSNRSI